MYINWYVWYVLLTCISLYAIKSTNLKKRQILVVLVISRHPFDSGSIRFNKILLKWVQTFISMLHKKCPRKIPFQRTVPPLAAQGNNDMKGNLRKIVNITNSKILHNYILYQTGKIMPIVWLHKLNSECGLIRNARWKFFIPY